MTYYTVRTKEAKYHAYRVEARSQADAVAKVEFSIEREYVPEGVKHFYTGYKDPEIGEYVIDVFTLDSRKIRDSNASI